MKIIKTQSAGQYQSGIDKIVDKLKNMNTFAIFETFLTCCDKFPNIFRQIVVILIIIYLFFIIIFLIVRCPPSAVHILVLQSPVIWALSSSGLCAFRLIPLHWCDEQTEQSKYRPHCFLDGRDVKSWRKGKAPFPLDLFTFVFLGIHSFHHVSVESSSDFRTVQICILLWPREAKSALRGASRRPDDELRKHGEIYIESRNRWCHRRDFR